MGLRGWGQEVRAHLALHAILYLLNVEFHEYSFNFNKMGSYYTLYYNLYVI